MKTARPAIGDGYRARHGCGRHALHPVCKVRRVTDTIHALLAIAMILTVVSLLVPLADRLRLPHTVLLAIAGMGLGFLGTWINAQGHNFGPIADVFTELDRLEVAT